MKALQLTAVGRVELVEVETPAAGDDEILVKTGASTICTSDLNDIRGSPFGVRLPVVMGHEAAGTVVSAGRRVAGFRPGDRVAAHPVHPCGRCGNCLAGMRHLCSSMRHFGLNMQGTFAERFVVRADRARIVPSHVPFTTAALAEPVCVCLEALAQARLSEGGALLIIGDGPFGVMIARLAEGLLLRKTVIAGHHDFRLCFARHAVRVNAGTTHDAMAVLAAEPGPSGYDAVILAVGTPAAAEQGLALLRAKGRLVVFSAVPGACPVDLFAVHVRELEIVGACNDDERLDEAVGLLADSGLGLGELVTHRFPIGEYREAFRLAETGREEAMKVAFVWGE